jgi:hypothetical protein
VSDVTTNGACHCGSVRFRVALTDGLNTPRRCDCSFCRMRGAVAVTAPADGLEIVDGADKLTLYQFNTGTAKHYFCSVCGIYTHHQRRSNPNELGVNAACLEGVSPFDFAVIAVNDGQHHPSDGPSGLPPVAGTLHYIPNPDRRGGAGEA